MIFHPEEYAAAQAYWRNRSFPGISREQKDLITARGNELIKFHLNHPGWHHSISFLTLALIFWADWWVLMKAGAYLGSALASGILIGSLHACIIYSLEVYTLHEGCAHKLIILRRGRLSRFFFDLVNNISRIAFAEPEYYAKSHLSHHAHFTTDKDDEFLNFISSRRFFGAFKPYAAVFNISDFKAHSGMKYNASRYLSSVLTLLYHGIFAFFMLQRYSLSTVFIALVIVFPNLAFWLDRMRQYMEHNTMPLSQLDGARDLGTGGWGMIVGGGPWGQPCHWTHHLYPGIPWYNQLILHRFIKQNLTAEQKKFFLLSPVIGFPRELSRVIRDTSLTYV